MVLRVRSLRTGCSEASLQGIVNSRIEEEDRWQRLREDPFILLQRLGRTDPEVPDQGPELKTECLRTAGEQPPQAQDEDVPERDGESGECDREPEQDDRHHPL